MYNVHVLEGISLEQQVVWGYTVTSRLKAGLIWGSYMYIHVQMC